MKRIYLLVGKKESGKSSAAAFIEAFEGKHRTYRTSFAEPLKRAVAEFTGVPLQFLYDANAKETFPIGKFNPRQVMQLFGSWVRDTFDEDWWARKAVSRVARAFSDKGVAIIDDCRYPNEVEMFRDGDFFKKSILTVVQIQNPRSTYEDDHPSETAQDAIVPDVIILNNGSLEHLKERISWLVDHVKSKDTCV